MFQMAKYPAEKNCSTETSKTVSITTPLMFPKIHSTQRFQRESNVSKFLIFLAYLISNKFYDKMFETKNFFIKLQLTSMFLTQS